MIRSTSKAAYIDLRDTGKLAKKKRQIYDYVWSHPGCTRNEIVRGTDLMVNCVSGRVRELLDSGILIESGCKKDPVTKQSGNCLFVNVGEGVA